MALYTTLGNAMLGVLGVALYYVWGLLTAFRMPLVWALLSSMYLRGPKEQIVRFLERQLASRSLAGCLLVPVALPLGLVADTFRDLARMLGLRAPPPTDAAGAGEGGAGGGGEKPAGRPASQAYFAWLGRAIVGLQVYLARDAVLRGATLLLTAAASGGVLAAVYYASFFYLTRLGYAAGPPGAAGAAANGGGGGRKAAAARGAWRPVAPVRGWLQGADRRVRRQLRQGLHLLVTVGLMLALLVGVLGVSAVLVVQVGHESSRAISSGYSQVTTTAVEQGMVDTVLDGRAKFDELLQDHLPKISEWVEARVDQVLVGNNLTHVKAPLVQLYEAVSFYMIPCESLGGELREAGAKVRDLDDALRSNRADVAGLRSGWVVNGTALEAGRRLGRDLERQLAVARDAATALEGKLARCEAVAGQGTNSTGLYGALHGVEDGLRRAWGHVLLLQGAEAYAEFAEVAAQLRASAADAYSPLAGLASLSSEGSELLLGLKDHALALSGTGFSAGANVAAVLFSSGASLVGFGMGVVSFLLNFVVYLTCLYYLLASEDDPLSLAVGMVPMRRERRAKVIATINNAVRRVFSCSLKMAAFHAGFTWLTLRVCETAGYYIHFTYCLVIAAAVLAAIPVIPPFTVSLPIALQLGWRGLPGLGLGLVAGMYLVFSYADDAVLSEIEQVNPYLTFLSIFGGLYFFEGVQGAVLGPLLLAILSCAHALYMDSTAQARRTTWFRPEAGEAAAEEPAVRQPQFTPPAKPQAGRPSKLAADARPKAS